MELGQCPRRLPCTYPGLEFRQDCDEDINHVTVNLADDTKQEGLVQICQIVKLKINWIFETMSKAKEGRRLEGREKRGRGRGGKGKERCTWR